MMTEPNESAAERLDAMLADGKVSRSEYDTLAAALEESAAAGPSSSVKPRGRLTRSASEGFLGGVCAGLADYFNVNVWFVRIFFSMVPGISLLAYQVLSLVVLDFGYCMSFLASCRSSGSSLT
jgi:phage shock protein PspC (stress-responsive transcriptional regulator)